MLIQPDDGRLQAFDAADDPGVWFRAGAAQAGCESPHQGMGVRQGLKCMVARVGH